MNWKFLNIPHIIDVSGESNIDTLFAVLFKSKYYLCKRNVLAKVSRNCARARILVSLFFACYPSKLARQVSKDRSRRIRDDEGRRVGHVKYPKGNVPKVDDH